MTAEPSSGTPTASQIPTQIADSAMGVSPSGLAINGTSARYSGWRVVVTCAVIATFAWALGFYGQGVYLAELQRIHGWSAATISTSTTFFYLFSSLLVAFVGDAIRAAGVRPFLVGAATCLALSTALLGLTTAAWQLYPIYTLMAFGWAGLSVAAISTAIGLWFDARRGLAISLALNGASMGGVIGVPLLVAAIGTAGFRVAMITAAILVVLVLMPLIILGIGRPPHESASGARTGIADVSRSSKEIRSDAIRDPSFWTITLPFALAQLAQVGFIVHQLSFMTPLIGFERASVAVSLMTAMAVIGRIVLGLVIDRLNQRIISAALFLSQVVALLAMANMPNEAVLFAGSAVFGIAIGNAALPSTIVHREFDSQAFSVVVSLTTAISGAISACGPVVIGVIHDLSGSYTLPLYVCTVLQIMAAIGVLSHGRKPIS